MITQTNQLDTVQQKWATKRAIEEGGVEEGQVIAWFTFGLEDMFFSSFAVSTLTVWPRSMPCVLSYRSADQGV